MDLNEVIDATKIDRSIKIKQPRLWIQCSLYLPDAIAEKLPAIEVAQMRGQYLLGFNFKPSKGEYFPYRDNIWRVLNTPVQFPARYKTRGRKDSPYIRAEHIAYCESEMELFAMMLDLSTNS